MTVLTAVLALGALTLALAFALSTASRRLRVIEDPRIDVVDAMLPRANCGACGHPGCRAFAEAVVAGAAVPAKCSVSSEAQRQRIADYLGVAAGSAERRVARLACAGGANVARQRAHYRGPSGCRAAQAVGGGAKGCLWGCLGFGDCERSCNFNAIRMDESGLPRVDEAACTACGDCVRVCPRDLFSLQAVGNRLWVACRNLEHGDTVLAQCEVGCTACGRCAADAPDGLVIMNGNLPVVDYARPQLRTPIERCPTGAIVWIDPGRGAVRGAASPPVLRRSRLPDGAS
ncbi:MAG: RnfABCDGE type electron transport complex subunit B [Pseudomonadales bacterium]|jgi:Na+-translocating ferredoxin:NAD+ oxidoreductase RNF subunit RnfB|nr:RnfABCDGE type electron transport complex subunit B [Pseudomonadales bacterium]MBP9033367.1 RnfABCDGE type electron transport complex subunit B [Pseudomonadales bacterium]